jgi:hypothetical protein
MIGHFILIDLLQLLSPADEVVAPMAIDEDLGSLREGVVVLGAHAGAVGPSPANGEEVTDLWLQERSWPEGLWLTRDARNEVSRFAAMANLKGRSQQRGVEEESGSHHDIVDGWVTGLLSMNGSVGEDLNGMRGAIERRTKDLPCGQGIRDFLLGRGRVAVTSVMPASIFRKLYPPLPVETMSWGGERVMEEERGERTWMVDKRTPAFARRKVPGSISNFRERPCCSANLWIIYGAGAAGWGVKIGKEETSFTGSPTVIKSVDFSPSTLATLNPPPGERGQSIWEERGQT